MLWSSIMIDKFFSDYQPCQLAKNYRHFMDHLCSHHQGVLWYRHQILMMRAEVVPETGLIAQQIL
jgi:hypothetical protein